MTETESRLPLYQSILIATVQIRGRVRSDGDGPRDALQRRQQAYAWDAGDAIVASYESVRFLPLATSSAFLIQQARRSSVRGLHEFANMSSSRTSWPRVSRGLPACDELPL